LKERARLLFPRAVRADRQTQTPVNVEVTFTGSKQERRGQDSLKACLLLVAVCRKR